MLHPRPFAQTSTHDAPPQPVQLVPFKPRLRLTPDGEYIVAGTTRPNVALEPDHVYLARYLE